MKTASYFLPFHEPELLTGPGSLERLPERILEKGANPVLLVVSRTVARLPEYEAFRAGLDRADIRTVVYEGTVPNPTIANAEEALALYLANNCKGIIGIGGGSQMDCAKAIGARVARPAKSISAMRGVLKVRKRLPPLFLVPTTAGTGSEVTIAAVLSNPDTHEKYALNDPALIPAVAVLDPLLTIGLPPSITAATGMDALTHAIEAYIGRSNTNRTREMAIRATRMIVANVKTAYGDGGDVEARDKMLTASYYAGIAFTRAYVGYVHAIAHTLGGFYGIAHGVANAVILPYVLEAYGKKAEKSLAELADALSLTDSAASDYEKAAAFIRKIHAMNAEMKIPEKIDGIRPEDIPVMADRAFREANPLYPVPRIFDREELAALYRVISV